jgi:CBS domain-containing protein
MRAARGFTAQLNGRVSIVHAYEVYDVAVPGILRRPVRSKYPSSQARQFMATTNRLVIPLATKYAIPGVRRLPVVGDRGQLVGVISLDDIIDAVAEQLGDVAGSIRNEQLIEGALRP